MMKTVLSVLVLSLAAMAPAWADGYLSDYGGSGGRRYLSDYHSGGYYAGRSSGYVRSYAGPNTPIERKHGADYYRYQERLHAQVEPGAGPRWARGVYNPMAIPLGMPQGSPEICGTYMRKPALCYGSTARYDPLVHGR